MRLILPQAVKSGVKDKNTRLITREDLVIFINVNLLLFQRKLSMNVREQSLKSYCNRNFFLRNFFLSGFLCTTW